MKHSLKALLAGFSVTASPRKSNEGAQQDLPDNTPTLSVDEFVCAHVYSRKSLRFKIVEQSHGDQR